MLKSWEPALEAEGTCLDTENTMSLQESNPEDPCLSFQTV